MENMSYDNWLEKPYQLLAAEADKFTDWAEREEYDLEDPASIQRAEEDYEAWLQDMAESWADDAYDRYQDALMDAYDGRYEYEYDEAF